MAKLVIKDSNSRSRLWLARRMAERLADSAYAGGELKALPAAVTWTTRLRNDAALHALPRRGPGGQAGPG